MTQLNNTNKIDRNKRRSQFVAFTLFKLMSYSVVALLILILGFITYKGIGVINWNFLSTAPEEGMTKGGIFPAIVGTLALVLGSSLFSFPI